MTEFAELASTAQLEWLCAALEGSRAQAGSIVSIGSWQAATLRFSSRRMAVVLLTKRDEVQEAAQALVDFDARGVFPTPELDAHQPLTLRIVAVGDDDGPPARASGLPVVSCQRLIAALRAASDTDEVWLDLACIADVGWLPFGAPLDKVRDRLLLDDQAAAFPDIDEFLDELDLPALWAWQSVHDAGDFVDLVTAEGPCFARVSVKRSHAVLVPLHLTDVRTRDFVIALAASLYADLDHLLAVSGPVADVLGPKPVAVQLTVDNCPGVALREGSEAVRIGWHADGRWLEVYLSGNVELAAASSTESFRTAIASAIAGAALLRPPVQPPSSDVQTVVSDPMDQLAMASRPFATGDKELVERVVAAWNQAPISLMAEPHLTSPGLSDAGSDAPKLHASIQQRIRGAVAGVAPSGVFVGRDARSVLNSSLVPACLRLLAQLTGPVGGQDGVLAATAYLQDRLSSHLRRIDRTSFDLSGPWGAEHLASHLDGSAESLTSSLAAETVLEVLLRSDLRRRGPLPDRFDLRIWSEIAALAIDCAVASQSDYSGLFKLTLTVRPDQFELQRSASIVDVQTYMRSRQWQAASAAPRHGQLRPEDLQSAAAEQSFQKLETAVEGDFLAELDAALLASFGTGMNGLISVLSSAAATRPGSEDHVVRELDAFDSDIAHWADVDLRQVRAARELLTLSPDRARDSPLDFWKFDAREARIATRPFIAWGASRVLFAPARVRATQLLFLNYLSAGRLPGPLGRDAPVAVKLAMNRLRQRANRDLERSVFTSFKERGWVVRERVKATGKGLVWLPGEVDLLAADVSHRRLWVIEVKDPARAFSTREIGDEVADLHGRFWEPDGSRNHRDEVAVLDRKSAAVRNHLAEALHFLNVPTDTPEAWTVRSAIVTRELSPAAFVQRSGVLFGVADQAADLLKMAVLPEDGFVWVTPS